MEDSIACAADERIESDALGERAEAIAGNHVSISQAVQEGLLRFDLQSRRHGCR